MIAAQGAKARPTEEASTLLARWLDALAKERRASPKTVEAYGRDLRQFLGLLCRVRRRARVRGFFGIVPCRYPRLPCHAARIRGRQPFARPADRGFARFCALPRARNRHSLRSAFRDPGAQGAALLAPPRRARARACLVRSRSRRGRGARALDRGARRGGPRASLWMRFAHLGGLVALRSRSCDARRGQPHRHRQGRTHARRSGSAASSRARARIPCPMPLWREARRARSFAAREAGRFRRASFRARLRACEARSAFPRARRRMRCVTLSPPIFWRAAGICARSRSSSAMPRCRRRKFTPPSIRIGFSRPIATPTRVLERQFSRVRGKET